MKTEHKFRLGSKVSITQLVRTGRVIAIYISEQGLQYHVRYFDNGEARTVCFFEDEIEFTQ